MSTAIWYPDLIIGIVFNKIFKGNIKKLVNVDGSIYS